MDYAALITAAKAPPRRYAPSLAYARGDLVEHAKFGLGVVVGVEPGKVELLFEDARRKLACA